jgi:hypothetical protein
LSLDQLMPIVRKVLEWADDEVASLAKRLTVNQIARTVNRMNWKSTPATVDTTSSATGTDTDTDTDAPGEGSDAGDAGDASDPSDATLGDENRVWYGTRDDGRWHLYADLDLDLGALVEAALDEARDALFRRHARLDDAVSSDPSTTSAAAPKVSDVDGLMELVGRSLDSVSTVSRRNRYRVNLYLDTDGALFTDRDVVIPESIAQLLTCDGTIDPVYVRNGIPVSVGRSQRTIPDRTRRAVLKRDGHRCQVPGCTAGRRLDLHHILHWSKHGPTDTWNLITLCTRHHRMHHQGRLGISGNADLPDGVTFADARGRPIRASGANPTPPIQSPPPIQGTYVHPYGERLESRWVTFNHPSTVRTARHQHPDTA